MPSNIKRFTRVKFIVIAAVLIMAGVAVAGAESNVDELQRKIADIGLLKQQLTDRRMQAEAVLVELYKQQKALAAEVRLLQKSYNFKSYQEAQKFDRAQYNIDLLRTIAAYAKAFTEKIRFYQSGHDKLTYLHQLAEDDIKMIATLNDFQIDALTTQISLVINRYLREAHIIKIDPQKIQLASIETVWKGIVTGRL